MQKACMLFILFTCTAFMSVAQPPGLCSAYAALMEESFTKFANLSGKELEPQNNYKRSESTYKTNGARSCYIQTSDAGTYWYAEYGSYTRLDEANLKIKSLQSEFIQCFPKLEFVENVNDPGFLVLYNLKETTTDGINFLKAEIGIYESNDEKYISFFRMPENAATVNYFNINIDPDSSDFTKGISRLLKESFTGFKNIIGNKVSQDGYSTLFFKTTYSLPGAIECGITEEVVFNKFEAYYLKNSNTSDPYPELEKLSDKVACALGRKYVRLAVEDGTLFIEASKADVNSSHVIEVTKEKSKGEKINILIRINEQTNN